MEILNPDKKSERSVKKTKGFTLIELLVVIAMIAVLSSTVFVVLGPARQKARDSRRKADLKQINTAMEVCYNDTSCAGGDKYVDTAAGANTVASIGAIMPYLPVDPVNTGAYRYTWTDNGASDAYYCLYVKSEAAANTWFCSSNRGVFSKTQASYTPSNSDCCGVDVE